MSYGSGSYGVDPYSGEGGGAVDVQGAATVASTGTITSAGAVGAAIGAAIAITATITAAGVVGTSSGATISETATITAAGSTLAANEGQATVAETATVTAAGIVGTSSGATVASTATITAAGSTGASSGAGIGATADITAAGLTGFGGASSSTYTVTITAAGQVDETGAAGASIAATVTITSAGAVQTYDTDTSNRDDSTDLDGSALVEWEPAIVATPARYQNILAMDTARAIQLTGIGAAGQPLITHVTKTTQRARDRILIGGVDFTYYRGVKTPTPDYRLIKPLLWGSGTLTLPQINPQYELLGPGATGALKRIRRDAIVVVQRINAAGTIIATDYVGFIDAINTSGRELSLTLGGHASGRASRDEVPPPVFRKKHDARFQILNYLRTLNLRTVRDSDELGISLYDRGGTDGLSHVNEMVALTTTSTGVQHDVTPTSGRVFDMVATDRDTIAATVYFDDALVTQQLDRAFSEEPDVVYATGRTWRGEVVNGAVAPGLVQGDAPTYPGLKQNGNSGAAVVLINNQLSIGGFLNYDDLADESEFEDTTEDAVVLFQQRAGLATLAAAGGFSGKVNEVTWRALWDLDVLGYSLRRARIEPMAQRDYTRKWNLSTNGGKLSRNRDWNPHLNKTAVTKDIGSGFTRHRIQRFARQSLAPRDVSNWQGTLALTSGVIAGEHTPGAAITAADVMSARALRPGMNIWAPLFDGGTLFHVSGVDVSNDGGSVSLILDTQARDTMAAWEAIARNRETRSNPARAWSGATRQSSLRRDTLTDWTDICGNLAHKVAVTGGEWTEIQIPAGQTGIIEKVLMQLRDPDEYAVLIAQRSVGLAALNNKVPAPLTAPPPDPQMHRIAFTGGPEGGTFTLEGNSNETAALTYGASAAVVRSAIRGLGGEFANARVIGSAGGAYVVTTTAASNLNVGDNSLTGGDSPSLGVTSRAPSEGDGTPWYEQEAITKWLDRRGRIDAWGSPDQPCGYDPSKKTGADGATAQPITGQFVEFTSTTYTAAQPGRLYLYVWTWADNYLMPGRILTQQLTSAV